MFIKRNGSKIFGAALSKKEQKALDIELQKQMAEYLKKNGTEIDSMVLWVLYEKLNFREKRLKDFFDSFHKLVMELVSHYELGEDDAGWLCTRKLLEKGIDVEAWEQEAEKNNE